MTKLQTTKAKRLSTEAALADRLFVLEASGNRVLSLNPDGSDRKVIVTDCRIPDGIAVDVEAGHIYWTNMGVPNQNDGSIERADLDGRNRRTIVPQGGTFTPKQLQLDKENGKLYWCDREGMRVMRRKLDGSSIELSSMQSHGRSRDRGRTSRNGVSASPSIAERGQIYWTQKGPEKGDSAASFARISKSRRVKPPSTAPISRCCTTVCRSPSIWSSISRTGSCTGPTAATLRAATR